MAKFQHINPPKELYLKNSADSFSFPGKVICNELPISAFHTNNICRI